MNSINIGTSTAAELNPAVLEEKKPDPIKELEDFIGERANTDVAALIQAILHCSGVGASAVREIKTDSITGDFILYLHGSHYGHALPVSEEAPAGVLFFIGADPVSRENVPVCGNVNADGVTLDCGVSQFVKTDISKLAPLNRTIAQTVMCLPRFIGEPMISFIGSSLDRNTGSLEAFVKLDKMKSFDDEIELSFSIPNFSMGIPPKKYEKNWLINQWKGGAPLDKIREEAIDVIRTRYRELKR